MRRYVLAALTAAMLLGTALPAAAHPEVQLGPTLPTDLTHAKTDNIEYLGRFPEHTGTAGGQLLPGGEVFVVTDPRGVYTYDVKDPANPVLLDSLTLYQHASGTGAALAQEDPDTDGKVLLVDGSTTPESRTRALHVIDISNPADLKVASSVGVTDHTWECVSVTDPETGAVNGCAYAYGRTGHIIDLTDPTAATQLKATWRNAVKYTGDYTHDLNEIRPGLVMSAGKTNILMDTTDPVRPVRLAAIQDAHPFSVFGYHSVEWDGQAPILIAGTELGPEPRAAGMSFGTDCEHEEAVIETWDATQILEGMALYEETGDAATAFEGKSFTKADTFDAGSRGIFLDGEAPANAMYCAHWFEPHPEFDGTGLVAVAYYDRGTRFVQVGENGKMSEIGWMVPAEGYAGSVQWVTNEIAYVMDYRRGMEILRLKPAEATSVEQESPTAIAVGSRYVPPSALHLEDLTNLALGGFGIALVGDALRRRRRRRAV